MKDLNKVYAVIDTNVLVSALLSSVSSTNPFIILKAIFDKSIIPIFNDTILSEYKEVLLRPKFHLSRKQVDLVLNFIISNGISKEPVQVDRITFKDPKDIIFYEVKMAMENSYLITGNIKHFPTEPFVVTPKQMVELLREKNLI